MKVSKYSSEIANGQLTERQAKKTAHAAGLTDLTLNRYGIWVAYNSQLDLIRVDQSMAKRYGII